MQHNAYRDSVESYAKVAGDFLEAVSPEGRNPCQRVCDAVADGAWEPPSADDWIEEIDALGAEGTLALTTAVGNHVGLAYRFFRSDWARARYWVTERAYDDDFAAVSAALDSACTDWRVRQDHHPSETGQIASLAVNGLGGREDFGGDGSGNVTGMAAAGPLGRILETYIDVMNESIKEDRVAPGTVSGLTDPLTDNDNKPIGRLPVFGTDALPRVLDVVGRDGDAFLGLRGAQTEYQNRVVKPGMSAAEFEEAAQDLAKVEGYVANVIGSGRVADAEARDASSKAWIDLAGASASELAGLASRYGPAGRAAGWGAQRMVDDLRKRAEVTWASEAAGEKAAQEKRADAAQAQFARSLLLSADAAGLNGYQQEGGTPLSDVYEEDGAVRRNADGTLRLITREEYDRLVGEGDRDKLDRVNNALTNIAQSNPGYLDMITRQQVETAFRTTFE